MSCNTDVTPGWHRGSTGIIAVAQSGRTDSYRDITVVNLSNTRLYRHEPRLLLFRKSLPDHHGIPRRGESNTHPQHMLLWRNIENNQFLSFLFQPQITLIFSICKVEIWCNFCMEMFLWCMPSSGRWKMLPRDRLVRQVHSVFKNLPFKRFCLSSFFLIQRI